MRGSLVLAYRKILLAVGDHEGEPLSMMRAFDLAHRLEATVDVLRVLPDRWRWLRWLPSRMLRLLDREQAERSKAAVRATRYWLAPTYGDKLFPSPIVVRTGEFVREVARHAQARNPRLIIMPPALRRLGARATQLALATKCRVLVPRAACRSRTILAASDLATPGLPVLDDATRLAAPLSMALVSFHNVSPYPPADDFSADAHQQGGLRRRVELAHEALSAISPTAVRCGIDPSEGIVTEARDRQVDLIVVGVKARSRWERLIYGNVASKVAERAGCSVLIAPILSGLAPIA